MRSETFEDALFSAYRECPCQVLPNALWKTLAEVPNAACAFTAENGRVMHLHVLRADALLLYWHRSRVPPQFPKSTWATLRLALLHADFAGVLAQMGDPAEPAKVERYFRLRHDLAVTPAPSLPPGFGFVDACVERETSGIAGFVAQCYDTIALVAGDVRDWPQLPVFDPRLAFWIVDTVRHRRAALAVSHFDARVPEVSLEWIQVHPAYRRRGLGTALVQETLYRAQGGAAFATVSGAVDNPTHPEALYRKCGFYGDDVWLVWRRR